MAWGTIVQLAGSYYGQKQQERAAEDAATDQARASTQAAIAQAQAYQGAMKRLAPFQEAGLAGLEAYGEVPMGLTEEDMLRLQEGTDAIRAMQAAQGRRKAGGSAEQLSKYASGFIGDVYNRAYDDLLRRANVGAEFSRRAAGEILGAAGDVSSAYVGGAQNQAQYLTGKAAGRAGTTALLSRLGGDIINEATKPEEYPLSAYYGPGF